MTNQWVMHVKDYAASNGMKYNVAMRNEGCRNAWKAKKLEKQKSDCRELLGCSRGGCGKMSKKAEKAITRAAVRERNKNIRAKKAGANREPKQVKPS